MVSEPERIRGPVLEQLTDLAVPVWFSTASSWEIAIKYRLGRLSLPETPHRFLASRLLRDRLQILAVELHHTTRVADLPDHHNDPFDRLLVAQAQLENMTLVSADPKLRRYDVDLLLT